LCICISIHEHVSGTTHSIFTIFYARVNMATSWSCWWHLNGPTITVGLTQVNRSYRNCFSIRVEVADTVKIAFRSSQLQSSYCDHSNADIGLNNNNVGPRSLQLNTHTIAANWSYRLLIYYLDAFMIDF